MQQSSIFCSVNLKPGLSQQPHHLPGAFTINSRFRQYNTLVNKQQSYFIGVVGQNEEAVNCAYIYYQAKK